MLVNVIGVDNLSCRIGRTRKKFGIFVVAVVRQMEQEVGIVKVVKPSYTSEIELVLSERMQVEWWNLVYILNTKML